MDLPELLRAWLEAMRQEVPRKSARGVALRVGLPVSTVNRLLRNERDAVSLANFGKMANHMGVSPQYLMNCVVLGILIRPIERPPKLREHKQKPA